ncbi:MAG: NUDIX domain-containing protein [Bacteroidota bacterium]|nr:NUDIX domain-containing protein [Bacteroidota bacterium]
MALLVSKLIEVCVFKNGDKHPLYLLLHRVGGEKIYPNIWQFITGSIESNEKAADAAVREVIEETGIKPTAIWVVPYILSFYDASSDTVNVCPFFAAQVNENTAVRLSEEHDDFGWFTYDEVISKLELPEWRKGLKIAHEYIACAGEAANLHRLF